MQLINATSGEQDVKGDEKAMTTEKYSDKSIVVRGDTEPHKDMLTELGGHWNKNLKEGGPGWIFATRHVDAVLAFIAKVQGSWGCRNRYGW